MNRRSTAFSFIAVCLALNYFAFRTELFADECRTNHPDWCSGHSISNPTLNWETFDKDNAPKAFVANPETKILFLASISDLAVVELPVIESFDLIRDKSPP